MATQGNKTEERGVTFTERKREGDCSERERFIKGEFENEREMERERGRDIGSVGEKKRKIVRKCERGGE